MVFGLFSGNKKSQTTNNSATNTNSNVAASEGGFGLSSTGSGNVNVEMLDGGAIGQAFAFASEVTAMSERATSELRDGLTEAFGGATSAISSAYANANRSEGANALKESQNTIRLLFVVVGLGAVAFVLKGRKA